jgi:fatty-acyl-CoA synthase
MIECREPEAAKRDELTKRLTSLIHEELGIDCVVCLVPRKTLPRTTSGKLSRSEARRKFLQRFKKEQLTQSSIDIYEEAV